MFHYFSGELKKIKTDTFLVNPSFWVQVAYAGKQKKWDFFLYPYLDDNKKSVFYFAFDTFDQKEAFEKMLKISGVGPKTAFQIVQIPLDDLSEAVKNLDTKVFQSVSWIWPKLAKKIILELKGSFQLSETVGMDKNQKLFKAVVKSLTALGYDASRVKEVLASYSEPLEKAELSTVVKRVIGNM